MIRNTTLRQALETCMLSMEGTRRATVAMLNMVDHSLTKNNCKDGKVNERDWNAFLSFKTAKDLKARGIL